jgi:hypothetical protein
LDGPDEVFARLDEVVEKPKEVAGGPMSLLEGPQTSMRGAKGQPGSPAGRSFAVLQIHG